MLKKPWAHDTGGVFGKDSSFLFFTSAAAISQEVVFLIHGTGRRWGRGQLT